MREIHDGGERLERFGRSCSGYFLFEWQEIELQVDRIWCGFCCWLIFVDFLQFFCVDNLTILGPHFLSKQHH